jgi:proteasome lid subunit RPN8/RPN11
MKRIRTTTDVRSGDQEHIEHTALFLLQAEIRQLEVERDKLRRVEKQSVHKEPADGRRIAKEILVVEHDLKRVRTLFAKTRPGQNTILFSFLTLIETSAFCCADEDEGVCVVAGCDVGDLRIGTNVIPIVCDHRSVIHASASRNEIARVALELAVSGLSIVAVIHSHPGFGRDANHPSGDDLRTQMNWEANTKMVSGIWSRDGYLRFFAAVKPLDVVVVGSNVQEIEPGHFLFETESE